MKNRLLVLVLVFLTVVLGLVLVATQFDRAQASQPAVEPLDSDYITIWVRRCPSGKTDLDYSLALDTYAVTCYSLSRTKIVWQLNCDQVQALKRFLTSRALPGSTYPFVRCTQPLED